MPPSVSDGKPLQVQDGRPQAPVSCSYRAALRHGTAGGGSASAASNVGPAGWVAISAVGDLDGVESLDTRDRQRNPFLISFGRGGKLARQLPAMGASLDVRISTLGFVSGTSLLSSIAGVSYCLRSRKSCSRSRFADLRVDRLRLAHDNGLEPILMDRISPLRTASITCPSALPELVRPVARGVEGRLERRSPMPCRIQERRPWWSGWSKPQ